MKPILYRQLLIVLAVSAPGGALCGQDQNSTKLGNGLLVKVEKAIPVNVDSTRDLHGPCVVRAKNRDLLLCHQDSRGHSGGDGFVRQWRSTDNGFTWKNEGPVADWRSRKIDSLFGEYGLATDGRLVMFVQRRIPLRGDQGIIDSWLQTSEDHGRTWKEVGPVDASSKFAVMYGRNIVSREGVLYVAVWSRLGNALYVSEDQGSKWQKRSVIFPIDHPDFGRLKDAGPPFYPHVVFCSDGSLLAMTYDTTRNCCYSRRSLDDGITWQPVIREKDLRVWAPRLKQFNTETLILTGRDLGEKATVAWFSTDNGKSWGSKLIVDKPKFPGSSYGYTDSLVAGEGQFWVFTSRTQQNGKGAIYGILLSSTRKEKGPANGSARSEKSLLKDVAFAEGFGAAFIYGSQYSGGRRPPLGRVMKYRDISPWQVFLIPDGPVKKVGVKTHPWDFQEGLHHNFKDKAGRKVRELHAHRLVVNHTIEENSPERLQFAQFNNYRLPKDHPDRDKKLVKRVSTDRAGKLRIYYNSQNEIRNAATAHSAKWARDTWPHFLVNQRMTEPIPLAEYDRLDFRVSFQVDRMNRLSNWPNAIKGAARSGMNLKFMFFLRNPDALDQKLFAGMMLFASNEKRYAPHLGVEQHGNIFYRDSITRGGAAIPKLTERRTVEVDVRELVAEALRQGRVKQPELSANLGQYAIYNFSIGFEGMGHWEAEAEISGLSLKGTRRNRRSKE